MGLYLFVYEQNDVIADGTITKSGNYAFQWNLESVFQVF